MVCVLMSHTHTWPASVPHTTNCLNAHTHNTPVSCSNSNCKYMYIESECIANLGKNKNIQNQLHYHILLKPSTKQKQQIIKYFDFDPWKLVNYWESITNLSRKFF